VKKSVARDTGQRSRGNRRASHASSIRSDGGSAGGRPAGATPRADGAAPRSPRPAYQPWCSAALVRRGLVSGVPCGAESLRVTPSLAPNPVRHPHRSGESPDNADRPVGGLPGGGESPGRCPLTGPEAAVTGRSAGPPPHTVAQKTPHRLLEPHNGHQSGPHPRFRPPDTSGVPTTPPETPVPVSCHRHDRQRGLLPPDLRRPPTAA
jgi:hypothetical protein